MNKKYIFAFLLILFVAIITSAAIIFGPMQPSKGAGPDEVVNNFYRSYLAFPGNPLVEKMYHGNGNLSPDFIQYLDEFSAGGMMYDPVLCAQAKPNAFTLADTEKSKDQASVLVQTDFEDHEFVVHLVFDGSAWLIDSVDCQ